MRVWSLLLFFSFLFFAGVLFLAVSVFDPNRYRTEAESFLSRGSGLQVSMRRLDLSIRWNPRLVMNELAIAHPGHQGVLLEAPEAIVKIKWPSLFRGRLEAEEIVLVKPVIYLLRDENGTWNWAAEGRAEPVQPMAVRGARENGKAFSIRSVVIREGQIRYKDQSEIPFFELDLEIGSWEAERDLLGPEWANRGRIAFNFGGEKIEWEGEGIYETGRRSAAYRFVCEALNMVLSGDSDFSRDNPLSKVRLSVHHLKLDERMPPSWRKHEYVTGVLTALVDAEGEGSHPEMLKDRIGLMGAFDVRKGKVANLNLFRAILESLDVRYDPRRAFGSERDRHVWAGWVESKDTDFDMMKGSIKLLQGRIFIEDLQITAPEFLVQGDGSFEPRDRSVDFYGQYILREAVGHLLERLSPDLVSMRNEQGRVVLPFRYRGLVPGATLTALPLRLPGKSNKPDEDFMLSEKKGEAIL